MDTRQLAAFCALVERQSFAQAAERLGVTQPAVSQQVRALEERLGKRLLDRSGRRVEPTEAGLALYRGAQRLLSLEGQLLDELDAADGGELGGTLQVGASTGPGSTVVPVLLCEFQKNNPGVSVSLSISDTQSVVERVAERELELGVVGAARRHRRVTFEPFFRDDVVLACPPGPGLRRVREGSPRVIVRWGLGELPGLLDGLGIARPFLIASDRWSRLDLAAADRWSDVPSDRIDEIAGRARQADGLLAAGGG